jgi:hypothetical protein
MITRFLSFRQRLAILVQDDQQSGLVERMSAGGGESGIFYCNISIFLFISVKTG